MLFKNVCMIMGKNSFKKLEKCQFTSSIPMFFNSLLQAHKGCDLAYIKWSNCSLDLGLLLQQYHLGKVLLQRQTKMHKHLLLNSSNIFSKYCLPLLKISRPTQKTKTNYYKDKKRRSRTTSVDSYLSPYIQNHTISENSETPYRKTRLYG